MYIYIYVYINAYIRTYLSTYVRTYTLHTYVRISIAVCLMIFGIVGLGPALRNV